MEDRYLVESQERWHEWDRLMPQLHFKENWGVTIIPPFGGAIIRFRVEHNGRCVSVYFDGYDRLGIVGQPYWEVYDFNEGPYRFLYDEVGDLMDYITSVLEK